MEFTLLVTSEGHLFSLLFLSCNCDFFDCSSQVEKTNARIYIYTYNLTLHSWPAKWERLILYNFFHYIPSSTGCCSLKTKGNFYLSLSSSHTLVSHQFYTFYVNSKEAYVTKNPEQSPGSQNNWWKLQQICSFFLPTIMAGCRHKQSKQIPKGADAKPVSLFTLLVTVTRNWANPTLMTTEYF